MRLIKYILTSLAICLWLGIYANAGAIKSGQLQAGGDEQVSEAVSNISKIIEGAANELDYKMHRGYLQPDEWNEDERRQQLIDHAYYTLFSRDPKFLLDLGPFHRGVSSKRFDATILIFRSAELAAQELARLKEYHLDNVGVEPLKSDENGFQIKEIGRFYIAVRRGAYLVLLDTTGQDQTVQTIAATLEQSDW